MRLAFRHPELVRCRPSTSLRVTVTRRLLRRIVRLSGAPDCRQVKLKLQSLSVKMKALTSYHALDSIRNGAHCGHFHFRNSHMYQLSRLDKSKSGNCFPYNFYVALLFGSKGVSSVAIL